MLPNPYTPGESPRILAGRDAQQDRIRAYVSRIVTYGEMGGPLLVFQGPRGVGKTSLLRDAQREATAHGFVTAWTSCRRDTRFLPDLVDQIASAIEAADIVPRPDRRRWRMRLDRVAVEVGVPSGVKVTASAIADQVREPASGARLAAIERLLHETSTMVRQRGGAGLLVFIDELHAPTVDDLAVLLNAVQDLSGMRADNPLAVITAGLPSTPGVLTRAATFGERSTFVTLPRLDDDAAQHAVADPAGELGVSWTQEALDRVVAEAQGFPYLLQVFAHATWDASTPVRETVLDSDSLHRGFSRAQDQLDTMFAARWDAATPAERQILTVMAQAGATIVTRSTIADALGTSTEALGVPRDRLIDKGIIESAGHGLLQFTMPGFDRYIREVTGSG